MENAVFEALKLLHGNSTAQMIRHESEKRKRKPMMKFSKEQLVFVVNCILSSAIDRVEAIPDSTDWFHASVETAGLTLATLYAKVTGSGMAIQDALMLADDFEAICLNAKNHSKGERLHYVDTMPIAKSFCNELFENEESVFETKGE